MKQTEFWKLGLQNVLAASLRSGLTVLGMAIGVAAILAVLTLGEAGRVEVNTEIGRLGIDQVCLTALQPDRPLTRQDGEHLQKLLETTIDATAALECTVSANRQTVSAAIIGCAFDTLESLKPEMGSGAYPTMAQWTRNNALVGEEIARKLRLSVGDWFSAGGMMLRCHGVATGSQQAVQANIQQAVLVPLATLAPLLGDVVSELRIRIPDGATPDEVAAMATETMLADRAVKVNAVSMQVQAEAAASVVDTFVNVLRWVALICMLVGGIGVTNILLVSVRERRREIGVMQALGASQMQICGLFLCEALIYALAGGILGLLLGGLLVAVAGSSIGLTPVVAAKDCTVVFLCAVLLGLLSGVAPAASASMLKPVDALRDE